MKKIFLVLLVLVLLLAFVGCRRDSARGGDRIRIMVSHVGPPGCARDVGSHMIGEALERMFPGQFEVQVYPAGQLGGQREHIEGMQQNAFQVSVNPIAYLGGFVPVVTMLSSPFWLPEDYDDLQELYKSPEIKGLFDTTIPSNFYTFNLYHDGYCHYTATRPLNHPNDVRGLRVRVMASPILMFQAETLGATPITMDWGETYSALQTGVIDGQDNPITNTYDMRLHEVLTHFTLTYHTTVEEAVYVNKDFFDNLSSQHQAGFLDAVEEGRIAANATTHRLTAEAIADMRSRGTVFIELTPAQRQPWIDATAPVRAFSRNNFPDADGARHFDNITAAIQRITSR